MKMKRLLSSGLPRRVAPSRPSDRVDQGFHLLISPAIWLLSPLLLFSTPVRSQDYLYTADTDSITITGYTGAGGAVIIPDTLDGLPVTAIQAGAFSGKTSLTSVTIPDSVVAVGLNAFGGCSNLTDVIIGSNVTTLGRGAFQYCSSLTGVAIPDSVTTIEDDTFRLCTRLTEVAIGSAVTSVGNHAFEYCVSLTNAVIGNNVTTIGDFAFQFTYLPIALLPDSVTSIGHHAYSHCPNLEGVSLGTHLDTIGDFTFENCTSLIKVTIPDSVSSIGSEAFARCNSLANVVIGNSVTNIGSWAFRDCTSLTNAMIPDNVISIGSGAFVGCTSLINVAIGNGLTSIGDSMFWNCSSLTRVTIPYSITNIGTQTFEFCSSLTNIAADSSSPIYSSMDGVLFNKTQTTLILCPEGRTGGYVIPNGVTGIRDSAFRHCTGLTSMTIGNSVTNIGSLAFWDCNALTSVMIGSGTTTIGNNAFGSCDGLTRIDVDAENPSYSSTQGVLFDKIQTTLIRCPGGIAGGYAIPAGVVSIENMAFAECVALTSVTVPPSVDIIGASAFAQCAKLTSVYFLGNAPALGDPSWQIFYGANEAMVYYLPGTTGWSNPFAGILSTLWLPQIQTGDAAFGTKGETYSFNILWAGDRTVVVEAGTSLSNPNWTSVSTNALTDGAALFSDPQWQNHPVRFFRLRSPP